MFKPGPLKSSMLKSSLNIYHHKSPIYQKENAVYNGFITVGPVDDTVPPSIMDN